MQESQEVMGIVGLIITRVQLLGQSEKGFRIVEEITEFKDGFWVGNVVLLEVTVQATPRRPAEGRNVAWQSKNHRKANLSQRFLKYMYPENKGHDRGSLASFVIPT